MSHRSFFKGPRESRLSPVERRRQDERVYHRSRLVAFARERGRCQLCRRPGFTTHHMRKRSQTRNMPPEYRHDPAYLLVACGSGTTGCHGLIEAEVIKVYGSALAPTFERWDGKVYRPWAPGQPVPVACSE